MLRHGERVASYSEEVAVYLNWHLCLLQTCLPSDNRNGVIDSPTTPPDCPAGGSQTPYMYYVNTRLFQVSIQFAFWVFAKLLCYYTSLITPIMSHNLQQALFLEIKVDLLRHDVAFSILHLHHRALINVMLLLIPCDLVPEPLGLLD